MSEADVFLNDVRHFWPTTIVTVNSKTSIYHGLSLNLLTDKQRYSCISLFRGILNDTKRFTKSHDLHG